MHLFSLDSIYILKGGDEEARRGGRKGRRKSFKLKCSNTFFAPSTRHHTRYLVGCFKSFSSIYHYFGWSAMAPSIFKNEFV